MHLRLIPTLSASLLAAALPAGAAARGFTPIRSTLAPATSTVTTTTATATTTAAALVPSLTDLSLIAAPSPTSATCNVPTTFKAFKAFGDTADYAFAPGGSFESGTAGWSLTGASVVSGNDTSGVFAGSKSLLIRDHGRVVSPWFCVSADHPTFRYTTRGGEVEMEIDYIVIGDNDIDDSLTGETNGGGTWAPSQVHGLATEIPAAKLAKGVLARLVWEAEDDVYVDNVLVDPYRRG